MGLRGSGKSTIGRLVAAALGRTFIDLDDVTPGVLGAASVREAWDRHGQEAFRRAEVIALSSVLQGDGRVVALGGGTPTAPMAADLIDDERRAGRCVTIYLAATAVTLRARLAGDDNAHRPSLTGRDPLTEIEDVLAARDPLYTRLADVRLGVDRRSPEEVVGEITGWFRLRA